MIQIYFFKENYYYIERFKGAFHKIFEGYSSYKPDCCPSCGVFFDNNVSPNIVERVMDSFYKTQKIHKRYLLEVLSFH